MKSIRLLPAAFLAASLPSLAQLAPDAETRRLAGALLATERVAGLVVGMSDAAGERYVAVGERERGKGARVDERTVFEIGSVSKAFTATLLALEATRGLDMDTPLARALPGGWTLPERARAITLRQVATHTSGLPRLPGDFAPAPGGDPYARYDAEALKRSLAGIALESDPGVRSSYSNLGYQALSHVLTTRAGKASFEVLAREAIYCPLSLDACQAVPGDNVATPHDGRLAPVPFWNTAPTLGGVGALRLHARDLLAFARAHASKAGPLAPAMALAQQVHFPGPPATGLAWQVRTTPSGRTIVWHNGATGGTRAFAGFEPATGASVAVLATGNFDVTPFGLHLLDPSQPFEAPQRRVEVSASSLAAWAGEYEGPDGGPAYVLRMGERLLARIGKAPPAPVEAVAPNRFASADGKLQLERTEGDGIARLRITDTRSGEAAPYTLSQRPSPKPVAVDPKDLAILAGKYTGPGGREFEVTVEGAALAVSQAGRKVPGLAAESSVDFVARDLALRIHFSVVDGVARELRWTQLGSTTVATK